MITDKTSEGYKLAEKLVSAYLNQGSVAAQNIFDTETAGMKFWIKSAVKETFQRLVKGD